MFVPLYLRPCEIVCLMENSIKIANTLTITHYVLIENVHVETL